jgi:hypothetical protein
MTDVEISGGTLTVLLSGWDRLFALKREIVVPLQHVTGAEVTPDRKPGGVRWPGSYVPGKITAGTYLTGKRTREFWLVRHPERAIVISLRDERYTRLVLEVADPEGTVAQIRKTLNATGTKG